MTIDELFKIAIERDASDLHLAVNNQPILRIDGELQKIADQAVLTPQAAENLIFGILSKEQKDRFIKERELDTSYQIKEGARFRVNLHWERDNIGLSARIIPSKIPAMEEIAMPEIVYDLVHLPYGLILVTGPTGCGKSTSLAAMIDLINQERSCHIVTLEDPIEFLFASKKSIIKQRQLGSDMLSFTQGLKHVLRQDPDVIMVGEMRDLETVAATLTLAETGHLVLATLHTPNAAQTINRIIDIFPPYQQTQIRMQLALSLKGVIAQQLLPKTNGGRIAAREIMINTPAIAHLIRENKIAQIKTVVQTSAKEGMVSLTQDLKRLVKEKLISKESAGLHVIGDSVEE